MNKKDVLQGVVILTIAAFIAKVLSAVYRIPLENFVGNTGFYIYQQVYPIYGIGMTLALNGLPIFISKLVVEQNEHEQLILASKLMRILLIFALVIFIGLNFCAGWLAQMMGDSQLSPVIRAVSWMFLWLPILAVGRGVAQGQLNMKATAFSQVIEQIIRVSIIILVAYLAMIKHWNLYYMGTLAMLSSPIAGGIASLIFINDVGKYWSTKVKTKKWADWYLWRQVLTEGMLISAIAAVLLILQLVDSFTIQNILLANGNAPDKVRITKGIYDRAQPIVQFSLVLATSFGTSLVPQLRQAYLSHDWQDVNHNSRTLLRLTLWLSTAATIGLICLMRFINQLLFGSRVASDVLSVYLLSAIILSLIIIFTSILQSIDQLSVLRNGLIVAIISKIGLNLALVHYLDIIGASWATVGSLGLMLGYIVVMLPKELKTILIPKMVILKMICNLVLMALVVLVTSLWLERLAGRGRLESIIPIIGGSVIGGFVLVSLTLLTKTLTFSELKLLPFGNKIIKHIKKRKTNALR